MDIKGWLRGPGLAQYEATFRDNEIDEAVLPHLTAEELKELGVASVGHRRKLLAAIAAFGTPAPSEVAPTRSTRSAIPKALEVSAERRPITVMFCDLVDSTSLAARLEAEDWRNLLGAYLDEASAAVTGLGGHVLEKTRRRADGPLRLSTGAGERRRARGAGGARDPARARGAQRQERGQGHARAFGAHRDRVRRGGGRRDRRGVRRRP